MAAVVMRLFGYLRDEDRDEPSSLSEVTIVADAERLRSLAAFFNHAAEQMEQHADRFGHEHYSDFFGASESEMPEIVVSRG